jgi:glucose 1-dehydrogenase/3-oxoacyl-[acyl-carrier protein] reductase
MDTNELSVRKKRVLVTGAGTGIGRGVALLFARAGADVALHYSHSREGAETAAEEARGCEVRAEAMQADFSKLNDVTALAERALAFLDGVDVLVNNAGITMNMPFQDVTQEQYETLFAVNVRAMFFLTQALVPAMREAGGGCVINISSVHAFAGLREHSVYAATKGAINSLTRQLAIELAPFRIRVNAIAAGPIEVENHAKCIPGYSAEGSARRIPAGFKGEPKDIGELAIFLASEGARYLIGQTIVVDGGFIGYMPVGKDFTSPFNWTFGEGYVTR